ncbi:Heterokaryon incompatibility protein (HET) domain containing protein [Elaphomyces granulatus]
MRLINTLTLRFEEFPGTKEPPYAILSHTWGKQEVTYDETLNPSQETRRKAGFQKIEGCCGMAREYGLSYAWVDSCCIDKRSSAELSEAINSMYRWYRDAEVCFVYLVDVDPLPIDGATHGSADQIRAFEGSRWFSRGWTLQELIAPRKRLFLSNDWSLIYFSTDGNEKDSPDELIASVTGISLAVLQHRENFVKLCVAERMSWASRRETTREEDIAYCLMGIFNVNMPILYGEGSRKAFRRLQEEIMKNSFDHSIFAWPSRYAESGLLAQSPADFVDMPRLGLWSPSMLAPFEMTNLGLSVRLNFNRQDQQRDATQPHFTRAALQVDVKTEYGWGILLVRLRPVMGANCVVNGRHCRAFRRVGCSKIEAADTGTLIGTPFEDILVLEDEHVELVDTAQEHHNARWKLETRSMLKKPLYSEQ